MSVSCFTSTNSHLCKFLRTTGRDWRNTIYIECGDCQRAVSRSCKNLLCVFDTTGAPVIVPVHDVEYLFSTTVDKSEFYRLNHHWWNLPVKSGSCWKMIRRQNEEKSRKESPF